MPNIDAAYNMEQNMDTLKPTITERRRQTRNKMFRYIYDADAPVSKQQIATAMGYSLPTVHQNIAELLDAGLIRPGEIQKSTGGRPAVGYTIDESVRFAVGIAVSARQLRILAADVRLSEIAFKTIEMECEEGEQIGQKIEEELEIFFDEFGLDRRKALGVGITFPGVIDQAKDVIVLSPTLRIKDISLSAVRKPIRFPVFIENDSTSGGAAEWLGLSAKEREEDFVYLFLENGIGGAVFINGKPYLGSEGRSGEFGHMCIVPDGRKCNCGKKGCLEAYCSAFNFTRDLGITADAFFDGLAAGNESYRAIWEENLDYLSIAINNLRMAFDCNVILGGFVSQYLKPYLPELKEKTAARNTFDSQSEYIKLGKYPTKAGMMGVAWHFMEEFIHSI